MRSTLTLSTSSQDDRAQIYSIRHRIYAEELHQHPINATRKLNDDLDQVNQYIIAKSDDEVVGFVSITPPSAITYSVDKYVDRSAIPYPFDEYLYEIRLLTVINTYRGQVLAH